MALNVKVDETSQKQYAQIIKWKMVYFSFSDIPFSQHQCDKHIPVITL